MKRKIIRPMNAYQGSQSVLTQKGWIFEPKLDGVRALCFVNKQEHFISRNGIDITQRYALPIARSAIDAKTAILDGEIIAYDNHGNPSFSVLQQGGQPVYIVFDILMKNGKSLVNLPLSERKKILESTLDDTSSIQKIPFTKEGKYLWQLVTKHNAEGVMAKDFHAPYYPGIRSPVWLKIKCMQTIDCVIMGYTSAKRLISSLALGLYDEMGQLHYIGKVGTGFNEHMIDVLYKKLIALPSFAYQKTTIKIDASIIWVKPRYVCEVKFVEITKNKYLRIPVFLRLRDDKKPKECTFRANSLE